MRISISIERAIFAILLFTMPLSTAAQGNLTPPAAPGPTMKSLAQIEPRTPILSLPYNITNSGSYYLAGNLTNAGFGNGITINADDVTLDFCGFTLIGGPFTGSAIIAPSIHRHIVVRNGGVRNWGSSAVLLFNAQWCEIDHLQIIDAGGTGLYLGDNSLVTGCTVTNTGAFGILAGIASRLNSCLVVGASNACFSLADKSTVQDSTARQAGLGDGFNLGSYCTVLHCSSFENHFGSGFNSSDDCVFTDCTASQNDFQGIRTGKRNRFSGCITSFNLSGNLVGIGGIFTGQGSVFNACISSYNSGTGIITGESCTLSDCICHANDGHGIQAGYGNIISGCTAVENTGYGLYCLGSAISMRGCTAGADSGGGIYVSDLCQITDNQIDGDINDGPNIPGIFISGGNNRIEANHLTYTHLGVRVNYTNGNNFVVRNSVSFSFATPYSIAPGNRDAQVISPSSAFTNASPWANFSF